MIFGKHEQNTIDQINDVSRKAERTALMADGHLGYVMPIGGVAAYRNQVSVIGVGFDIACGNAAIRTDLRAEKLTRARYEELADEIQATICFGVGGENRSDDAPIDDPLFGDPAWDAVPARHRESLRKKARAQLGSVGGGNHYVDVFEDESGDVWVGVHFGSRGFGYNVARGFLALAQGGEWNGRAPEKETLFSLDTPIGSAYWELMSLAGRYAYAGREWVARKVVEILGANEKELVHNHHNFAWRESHDDAEYIVIRKGATPAWPGQRGFVGGTMGDDSVILEGSTDPAATSHQQRALYSTVHGAGRVMSRTEAAGTRRGRRGKAGRPGKVSREMMKAWIDEKGVVLRGGGLDESPHAYRRLPDVLRAQGKTIKVIHTLRPIIVVMAR
ncbi:MAG: RtcB family protein [Myxococcales bacterium]|nr:RtcB family protein [Myxococcales bacterium]